MLVVPELQHELECLRRGQAGFPEKLGKLRQRRDALSDAVQLSAWRGGRVLAEASSESPRTRLGLDSRDAFASADVRGTRVARGGGGARRRRTGWACASFTLRSIRCGVR